MSEKLFDVAPKADIFAIDRPLIGTEMAPTPSAPGGSGPVAPADQAGSTLTVGTATSEADLTKLRK